MYSDGQILGASTTSSVAVVALPLTSGNSVFQSIVLATAVVALTILIVRIVKLTIAKRSA